MIKGMFINAFILISFLFIGGHYFKDRKHMLTPSSSIRTRLIAGIFGGVFGCALMAFSFQAYQTILVDFRFFAIIITAIYGGWISSIIAGLIIAFVRILLIGVSSYSVAIAVSLVLISICCSLISRLNIHEKKKWIYMIMSALATFFITITVFLDNKTIILNIFFVYIIGSSALGIMVYYLSQYINESNRMLIRLKEESYKDFLTGLNNVRQFDIIFNDVVKNTVERGEKLSFLFIDIDFFKKVNDIYGHSSGDVILKELGNLLMKTCRYFDVVSRIGGEEFSVLLIDCPVVQAVEVAERIRAITEKHNFIIPDGNTVNITLSIGVATYPDTTDKIEELKEQADTSLHRAKHTGRNKVCVPDAIQ